jgi:hypothetical protein
LAEGAAALAQDWVAVKSTIRILSFSSVGSCLSDSSGRVAAIIYLLVSLFHRCAVSCSALGCQAWACTRCTF